MAAGAASIMLYQLLRSTPHEIEATPNSLTQKEEEEADAAAEAARKAAAEEAAQTGQTPRAKAEQVFGRIDTNKDGSLGRSRATRAPSL